MRYLELKRLLKGNIFDMVDVGKLFPAEKPSAIRTQLYRFMQKGLMFPLKRGLYCFEKSKIDEFSEIRQERTKGDSYRIGSRI